MRAGQRDGHELAGEPSGSVVAGTAGALLDQAGHELRTPLNAICGFAELGLTGGLGPVSAPVREAFEAVAQAARALETTAQTIVACRHALPREPRPAAPVDLGSALRRAGFELAPPPDGAWPTVVAEAERLEAGLAAARRWLCRHTGARGRVGARLETVAGAISCVLEARGEPRPAEGLGGLDLSLARVLLDAEGVRLSRRDRDLGLVWSGRDRDPLASRVRGSNFSA